MKTSTLKQRSEVDVRVAQELKNDKDFKYQISQSVQSLAQEIKSLKETHEKTQSNSHSDRNYLSIEFKKLIESVIESIRQMDKRLGDLESKSSKCLEDFNKLREEVVLKHLTKQEFYQVYVKEVDQINALENRLDERDDHFNFSIETVKSQLKQDIEMVKRELTPKVPEIDPIKQQLDERFKVLKVDFDGLIKEIAILKKAVAYDQKKFENIYTLIERLKEGK